MASLLGILFPACAAALILCGRLPGVTGQSMHSLSLGLALLALAGLVGKLKLGRTTSLDFGLLLFILLGWAGLWTNAPGAPRWVRTHPEAALFACLLGASLLSPLLGRRPFTASALIRRLPRQLHGSPDFLALARRLERTWAAVFAACLASTLVPLQAPGLDGPVGGVIFLGCLPSALVLGLGPALHRRRVDHYLSLGLAAVPAEPERPQPQLPQTPRAQEQPCSRPRRTP